MSSKPTQISKNVVVKAMTGKTSNGTILIESWPEEARRKRAFKLSSKVIGGSILVLPFCLVFHILAVVIIPGSILGVCTGCYLYFKTIGDNETFVHVESDCPKCGTSKKMTPYINNKLLSEMKIYCKDCGGTYTATMT